ncbi:hypothetical protein ACJMK2_015497 [Sinanodonta woodiana]|uniref:Sushi domain-containing protein n=1 Tax=Sinanodonta woodiana TaxID=1069815 RepID=A0ABD3UTT4_SINWO
MNIFMAHYIYLKMILYTAIFWTLFSTIDGQGAYCPIYVTNGRVDANCTRAAYATCSFTCDKGYVPAQNDLYEVTCLSDGKWSPNPACLVTNIGIVVSVNPEPTYNEAHLYSIAMKEDGLPEFSLKRYLVFSIRVDFRSVAADYGLKHLYVYDHYTNAIYRDRAFTISLTGDNAWFAFHSGVSRDFLKLAADWVNHNIYWTDPMFRWIVMQRMDTSDISLYKVIVYENVEAPYGIAVDPNSQYLFWSNIGNSGAQIRRSNLLGQNTVGIVDTKLLKPVGMAVDHDTKFLFWVDAGRETIESCDYGGLYRQSLRRFRDSELYDISLFKNVMYVTDTKSGMVYFLDKRTANNIQFSFNMTGERYFGVGVFNPDGQPIDAGYSCSAKACSHMCTYVDDLPICVCKEGFVVSSTDDTKCLEDLGVNHRGIVLSDNRQVCVLDIRSITYFGYSPKCIIQTTDILAFTMDMWGRIFYLANSSGLFTGPMFNFGTGTLMVPTAGKVTGLDFDWIDQYLYWSENRPESNGSDVVMRMPLSVTPYSANIFMAGLTKPRDVVVTPFNRKVFWISGSVDKRIEMANFDSPRSSRALTIIDHTQLRNPKSLTFGPDDQRLYWIDYASIYSAKMDGTNVTRLFGTTKDVMDLVFVYKGHLLWSQSQTYYSTIMSNEISSKTLTTSGTVYQMGVVTGLKAFEQSLQPKERGPCDVFNGGCEHLCVPSNFSRICKCMFGYTLAADGINCTTRPREDNFALVTDVTHNVIYQVEMASQDVYAIDTTETEGLTGLAYESKNKQVIWGTDDGSVNAIFLNGSFESRRFSAETQLYEPKVQRIAIDFSTLNIYFTGKGSIPYSSIIGVISPTGQYAKIVTGLREPSGIALHPSQGLMFWTEKGTLPHIGRASMNGDNIQFIIKSEINQPTGITIDYSENKIYWTDNVLDRVERSDFNGNGRYIVSEETGAKLLDIVLSGNYLFFTALERQYVTKMNKNNKDDRDKFAARAEFGGLESITIYNSSETPPTNSLCSKNNGDCDQFCIPMPNNTRVCRCQEGDELVGGRNCNGWITCPQDITDGSFTSGCDYQVGTQCSYQCNVGYKPSNKLQILTCGRFGEWDIQQPCEVILCPDYIPLGFLPPSCNRQVGTTCTYGCSPGLTIAVEHIVCQQSGIWNKDVTTLCQRKFSCICNVMKCYCWVQFRYFVNVYKQNYLRHSIIVEKPSTNVSLHHFWANYVHHFRENYVVEGTCLPFSISE